MRTTISLAAILILSGCTTLENHASFSGTGSDCGYIGCESGGFTVYPHEQNSGTELARRWYGINGELPSDYPTDSAKYQKLRRQQIQKLRSMGLGPHGRPLAE